MSVTAWRTAYAALGRLAVRQPLQACMWSPFSSLGSRATSSSSRKRRRTFYRAMNNPDTHPGTLRKLREGAASPSHSLLRYLAENKVHKAVTQADRRNLWFTLQFKKYAPVFVGQVKPRMQFWTAALDESQLPLPRLPEVAIAGRSNTGKSTLVNYLCGRHSAKVTRMPGSTRELVFWRIGRPAQLCVVDLPGYGFAHAPQETRLAWTEFSLWYLRSRKNLVRVLLLVDARQGLKPSDREMIAYLERHGVSWQVIVTKCDTVKAKDLARRLTVLEEDLAGFHKMIQAPIPISALKRKGMEKLRDVLDRLKVQKEVVKDGIKRRVYDLLEEKRIQRAERARARRERRQQKEEEQKAQEAAVQDVSNMVPDSGRDTSPEAGFPNLHAVLDDSVHPAHGPVRANGDTEENGDPSSQVAPKQPEVAEARYSLEDRDSRRIDTLMTNLFPDLSDMRPSEKGVGADAPWLIASQAGELMSANTWKPEGVGGHADLSHIRAQPEDDSGSDSDWEEPVSMPPVLRFDPSPGMHAFHQGFGFDGATMSSPALPAAVSFGAAEGLGSFPSLGADRRLLPSQQVGLRPGWERPPSHQDRMYDEDDFATPEEQASGTRRWSPPAPTAATRGQLMAEARKRYEREWATELESVENARSAVTDAGGGAGRLTPRDKATAVLAAVSKSGSDLRGAPSALLTPPRPTYIMKGGRKPVPKRMRAQWRNFGRPPAVILKKKRLPDIAEDFGLKQRQRRGRKRNFGDGLTWSEAKGNWINWFKASKKRNIRRVLQAKSPKQEDVQAEFEERKQRLRRRGGSHGRQHAQRTSARFGSMGDQAEEQ